MRPLVFVIALITVFIAIRISHAHEVPMHKKLTLRAVDFLTQKDQSFVSISNLATDLLEGSEHEDDSFSISDLPLGRFYFHFLPALNSKLNVPPDLAITTCDSLQWGFGVQACTAYPSFRKTSVVLENTHRWQEAISHSSVGAGFKELGYILHLLEDLVVPAHTRNDPHPPLDTDRFEKDQQIQNRCEQGDCMPNPNDNLVRFVDAQEFFIKLRDFTATNFFSKNTIKDNIFAPSNNCDITTFDWQTCGPTADRTKTDRDYYYDVNGRKLAYRGYLGPTIDEVIAREQFNTLAPLAVLYTASLIKFYFDTINPPEPTTWVELSPAGAPPSRRVTVSAVYDDILKKLIIFGGHLGGPSNLITGCKF